MHQEQTTEQKRLDTVVQKIDQQLLEAKDAYAKAHSETRAVESNYIANTSINTAEVDDSMETNAEIQQQRNIVARVTETENIMAKSVDTLTMLRPNPYFGRVDIVEDNWPETLYIGLASLQDDEGEFLIYDWRAPIMVNRLLIYERKDNLLLVMPRLRTCLIRMKLLVMKCCNLHWDSKMMK